MMLRELEAFEACWLDLKDIYPTSGQDNTLIAHAMGQLVDLLEKPARVEQNLPSHLKTLFRQLALAYFRGYSREAGEAEAALVDRSPVSPPCPTSDRQRRQEISAAVERVKALAQKTQSRMCTARGQVTHCALSELETLVIDFPEHWQPVA
ncbi:hypothetical protein IQ265_23330 [Nodosilinea sp. LEGE 06152]|uniref:hypothetical protein n=1 Tax=Nodosilinea sp. LEGE 06152 TaxID=2777966 RepID=UPI001882B9A1|nr:hypothetical protein [Nodosilinea sp. LEGE 06152]MBE9159743.1 hypothetical protein [Nodosilinea sp. LEGE 06152]